MRSLTDFVEAQASYFDQCNQHAQGLQKQLGRSVQSGLLLLQNKASHNSSLSQLIMDFN